MDTRLDFTDLIGRPLPNLTIVNQNALSYYSEGSLITMTVYNLKKNSYKETILNIIPVEYDQGRTIDLGTEDLSNPYAGFVFINYRGIIITDKYVYPFYQPGDIEIEEIQVVHLVYKIEGNLWVKQ